MIRVSICYPKTEDSHFDMDYYINKHMKLVEERMDGYGLVDVAVDKVIANGLPKQAPVYAAIGYLTFETLEGFQNGMREHGREIVDDIPNFTNVHAVINISEIAM